MMAADIRAIEAGASAEEFAFGGAHSLVAYIRLSGVALAGLVAVVPCTYFGVARIKNARAAVVLAAFVLPVGGWASLDRTWSTGSAGSVERAALGMVLALPAFVALWYALAWLGSLAVEM